MGRLRYLDNPFSLSKDELYEEGLLLCRTFLRNNRLYLPTFRKMTETRPGRHWKNYGYFNAQEGIVVNVDRSLFPVRNPGHSWSFPGYKADLTPIGILAHETGHYVDFCRNATTRHNRQFWRRIITLEDSPVSSYEPSASEAFAEAMKLFITNPNLLFWGRPMRYRFITETLGLKPIFAGSWQSVLKHAHDRIHKAAYTWIDKSIKVQVTKGAIG